MAKRVVFNPKFVGTQNTRNFAAMMDALALADGTGVQALVYGQAGRGKTRTAQWWAANHQALYLRTLTIWKDSELGFLQAILRETGILNPPHRKNDCFREIVDGLIMRPRPLFLDEVEKMNPLFLEVVRDISDMTGTPIVLIGEEELADYMRRNRRTWSRTFQVMEFEPISQSDILMYVADTTGLTLNKGVTAMMHQNSGGDFRLVYRDLLNLVAYANAKNTTEVTEEMAEVAFKMVLKGK